MDSCCNSSLVQLYKPSPAGFSATVRSAFVVGLTLLWTVAAEVHASGLPVTVDGQALPSLAPMLERVTPAVVNIAVSGKASIRNNRLMSDPAFKHFFKREQRTGSQPKQSLGSGVIIDASKGLVLTNHHLVEGAGAIVVNTRDGRVLRATLVGLDDETDLAVIRVLAERLSAVPLADSDALRVGDFVVAIGNPFGLGQTVTSGIVSALSRSGLGIRGYEDFIQTDASINVGNSGGALVNLRGELVGINTAIFSPGGGSVGIGFAIPIRMAMSVASQLISFGHVKRGALGVAAI
ncbi:MAG: trypsin-like serine protease, partial [Chromatiales bacterium]|nr:trypsin-like serine protease [Chromatiales bacterium]